MGTICLVLLVNTFVLSVVKIFAYDDFEECPTLTNNHLLTSVIEPYKYRLELILELQEIHGISNIFIQIHKQTQVIILHSYKLEIKLHESSITSYELGGISNTEQPYGITYCKQEQLVKIEFDSILRPGIHKLKLSFITSIGNKGFIRYPYTTKEGNTKWVGMTLHKPIAARRVFPCWDQPDVRLIFNISIMHFMNEDILSNMPKTYTLPADRHDMQWTYFNLTPPISSYQVAIAVIDKTTIRNVKLNEMNIMWYGTKLKETAFAQMQIQTFNKSLVSYTQQSFDIMPKTDYIVLSEAPMNIIESPGLVTIRKGNIKYDENEDFLGAKLKVLKFVGRHIANQLIYGIASPLSWDDSWFNEALALYLSYYISSEVRQDSSIMDLFVVQILQPALHSEVALNLKPIIHKIDYSDEIETSLYSRLYHNKGSALIHMIQYITSPKYFRKSLRDYLSLTKKNNQTSTDAFWNILESILYANLTEMHPIVKIITDKWIAYKGCPIIYVKRLYEENYAKITSNCDITSNWDIPITYIRQSNLSHYNDYNMDQWVLCNQSNILVEIDASEFVLFNIKQSGYYRVNYDTMNWQYIANYLNYKNYTLIHVRNRAQIIDDAHYFMRTGDLNFYLFLNIIRYLKRETNYIAWYPMFNILSTWSIFLQYPESDFIKPNLLEILSGLLDNIGYEEYPEEKEMKMSLRLLATKWACKLGHKKCREAATAKLVAALNDLKNRTGISPWWKDWIYCAGMMHLNESLFLQTAKLSIRNQDMETLKYLTCSENPICLGHYMDLLLTSAYKKEKILELYYLIIKKHADKDEVLRFITTNYDFLKMTFFPSLRIEELWSNIIMNIHFKESISKVKEFLQNRPRLNKTTRILIQRLLEAQEKKMEKIRSYGKST